MNSSVSTKSTSFDERIQHPLKSTNSSNGKIHLISVSSFQSLVGIHGSDGSWCVYNTHVSQAEKFINSLTPIMNTFSGAARQFSTSAAMLRDSMFKITRYAKPQSHTVYKEGDKLPNSLIPRYKKLYPEYDYETMFFKRQNRGLFAGLQRRTHKRESESKVKNLKSQLPNIVKTKLWSETLNRRIATKATTTALRTITKDGGLDNYLLKSSPMRIKTMGLKGWKLRYDILKKKEIELNSEGSDKTVYHILGSGKKITVGRKKLLETLYPYVYKDSYTPTPWKYFIKTHTVLTTEELVQKLEAYGHDFADITV